LNKTRQGRGNRWSGGQMIRRKFSWGSKMVFWPRRFG